MKKRYYTLRFEHTDAFRHAGVMLANADHLLHIGQGEGYDVRLPDSGMYADAEWAVIERNVDGEGWKLIRTSPFHEHEIRVNGEPVTYVHFLSKGDRISFEGLCQELLFDIREDEAYTTSGIVTIQRRSKASYVWLLLLTLSIVAYIAFTFFSQPMTEGMIDDAKTSIYQIKVDSISLVSVRGDDTLWLETCQTEIKSVAFLTTDSQLVTARHCIEPWLNIPDTTTMDTVTLIPVYVRMALKAETHNILADDGSTLITISHCSVWQTFPGYSFAFTVNSSDFLVNRERDLLVEYGDFDHQYIWRSISARPRRTDMMLGDIACLPVTTDMLPQPKGTIRMATKEDMNDLCKKDGRKLVILGSPASTIEGQDIEKAKDELRRAVRFDVDGFPCSMLAHNGEIAPGFSGGPVLTRCGAFGWCAIGVVSVTDKMNNNRCYSVPITEIERMKFRNHN